MAMQSSTLRPGLLVSLKTSVSGNVKYEKRDIESKTTKNGPSKARWETERTIFDPVEHEAAIKVRSKVRSYITTVCSASAFGLLCAESNAEDLDKAIADARRAADDFNATAKLSRIRVYVITGRIAQDDMEAVKAINSEVSELLLAMEKGVDEVDVDAIREAANKAKGIAEMLNTEARLQAEKAIDAARRAARNIKKFGDGAAEVDRKAIRTIREARTVFLDLDDAEEIATPKTKGRVVEMAAE